MCGFSQAGTRTVRPSPDEVCTHGESAAEEDSGDAGNRESAREEEEEEDAGQVECREAGARRPRPAQDPGQPTRREREEHSMTHLPYRAWCQHCVRGKGRPSAHRRSKDTAEREKPLVAMDYTYFKTHEQEKHRLCFADLDRGSTKRQC